MKRKLITQSNTAIASGKMVLEVRDSKTGKLKRTLAANNKIMASAGYGMNLVMRRMAGDATYSINLNKLKIGTDSTAPAASQTDLIAATTLNESGSSLDRGNVEYSNTSITLSFFLSDADLPNGTYKELGIFTDDERIFTRVLIDGTTGWTKATNEDATIRYTITINPN